MISKRIGERKLYSTHCYHICFNLSRDIVHYIFINLASISSSLTPRRIRVMELNLGLLNRYLLFLYHLLKSIGDANCSIQFHLYISPHLSILYFVSLCIDNTYNCTMFYLAILSNLLNNYHSHYLL